MSGLSEQMKQVEYNKGYYSNLNLDMLTDLCIELAKGKQYKANKIRFIIDTDKGGAIEYQKNLYRHLNVPNEEILELEKTLNETLEEGMYRIDEDGVTYSGKL